MKGTNNEKLEKLISILLVLFMSISIMQPAVALWTGGSSDILTLKDASGNTIAVDESWEETFPYGTFAFENSEFSVGEGKESRITVYRLGGTKGRATAYISVSPVIAPVEDGGYSLANAAGTNDYGMKAEDTLPVAAYQPVGRDRSSSPIPVPVQTARSLANVTDESGQIEKYGDTCIYADVDAETYQWQVYRQSTWGEDVPGEWESVASASDASLMISNENYADFDYRCLFTTTGAAAVYSTDTARGIAYEPFYEVLPEMPEGLELYPEPSYTSLPMQDGEFDSYLFTLTFADGEWKKEVIINARTDALSEADELAVFTIVGCEGGSLYDTAQYACHADRR